MERVESFFEAVRTIEDVMEFLKRYSIDERMVCIVFKKAFDTVSKGFLFRTLSFFGFRPYFIQWIHAQFTRISRVVS